MSQPKEEVVISGIGGKYPESDNLDELKELLFKKVNAVTSNGNQITIINDMGKTNGTGKMRNPEKFDNAFFKTHPKLTQNMDPLTRLFLERSVEAIVDAGISPLDLQGTNTSVFSCTSHSESEIHACNATQYFSMLGCSKAMQANRVSYILDLNGPSVSVEGGWICSSNGLARAKQMIEDGTISAALVGVTNVTFRPEIQYQYQGLNKLNNDNQTKSFDFDADGYNRSDATIVILLQRASEAKRNYATLLGVKSQQFGNHDRYITGSSRQHFKSLLLDCYHEANVDPATVDYIEAYGSGIQCEDTMELNVMEEVFCTDRREIPLKVGSVKSNIGHCDVSSLFASIAKAIIAFEGGYIPPNINYTKPNQSVPALINGKIQVVTESTPLRGDVIGITTFCGVNGFSHVILKRNNKVKNIKSENALPRLLLVSGRYEEIARNALKKIQSYGNDEEFVALTNNVFTRNINSHFYRTFSIFPTQNESENNDVWNVELNKRPVWFIFSGMGSQWQGMGTHLMKLPIFAEAINKCDSILKLLGVNIKNILTSLDPNVFDNILNSFVGIASVQIGLVDVLNALDVKPDGIIGHSVGELGCAYADGCFTAEEMILSAYFRGLASLETELIPGMMAAIGLGYDQIKDKLPHDIDVACRNSSSSCTISGPVDSVNKFVSELKSDGIFAKAVNVAGIAYHSRYIQSAGPALLKYLKNVIKEPKLRSSKWLSSSIPESKWDTDLAKYSSPEYHTNNLLNSVLFEDVLRHVPKDAITIEIAPHGLLQAIIRDALPNTVTNIPLTNRVYGDSIRFLLTAIGKMYVNGINPIIQELYPKVNFPVSRGTPSIHSLPFWDHRTQWLTFAEQYAKFSNPCCEKRIKILLNDNVYLIEHEIHGYHVIPLSYVLFTVWNLFVGMNDKSIFEASIQFNNLRFKNNVIIHPTESSDGYFMIQSGTGCFEYIINDEIILTGQVKYLIDDDLVSKINTPTTLDRNSDNLQESIPSNRLYNALEKIGFNLKNKYKNITSFEIYKNNILGYINWENDWIYFLGGLLMFPILENIEVCTTEAPVSIRQISIVPTMFEHITEKRILVDYNTCTNEISCKGIKISDVISTPVSLPNQNPAIVKLEEQGFIHFDDTNCENINSFINDAMDIIMEADKLGLSSTRGQLIVCTPYHYDDAISKDCTTALKTIVENQKVNSKIMNWENVKYPSEDDESGKFITVTNNNYLQDTTKSLTNKKCSYIIVSSKHKLQDLKEWKTITQQKYYSNYLILMKKKMPVDRNSIFVKYSNDDNDSKIWKTLMNTKEMIYIISKSEPLEGVKSMFTKYKTQRLRFLFILDSNAPEFDTNKSFYMDRLSIGLIVNVYKAGGWGTYKRIALHNLKPIATVNENAMLNKFKIDNQQNLKIKRIALNFNDLVVEDNTENTFGPLEYSGVMKNDKNVMGITTFNHISSQLHHDAALSWPVPPAWTFEDAASVPLSYALNYYVFNVMWCPVKSNNSILVTSGLHAIGQAAISICLAAKYETYAVVDTIHQADQLSHIFPELPRSRIIINRNNMFDIKLKMLKPQGFDLILNFLSDKSFSPAFSLTADFGHFFQFSMSDIKNYRLMGTRPFINNISFSIVSSNLLLNESESNKRIVHQAFLNGLNKGVIKPFRSHVITTFDCKNIFDTMRTSSASTVPPKVILTLNDDFMNSKSLKNIENDTYICKPDHVYVIFGNKSDWLDITEWLVDRGAKQFVINVSRYLMTTSTCRRLNKLLSQNVSVHIESDFHIRTKEDAQDWLTRLSSSNLLGSLFIINQTNVKKINNLRLAFEHYPKKTSATSFVCISSRGGHICNELKSNGLNAINISWNGSSSQPKDTRYILPVLDAILLKSHNVESSTFVFSDPGTDKSKCGLQVDSIITNFFPESANELKVFNEKRTIEAGFVEVTTKSPRLSQLKSVLPVFVIPGFKPTILDTLYKQFFYPIFEAQLPDNFTSIDELSVTLVNKLKKITDQGYVSIIGESWGGNVALKMAQILEEQGTMVTVTLIESDPVILTDLAKNYLSNDNLANKLETLYSSFSNQLSIYDHQTPIENVVRSVLHTIRFRLQALLDSKPFSNKLLTKVLIVRREQLSEFDRNVLHDYCINPAYVHIIPNHDYKQWIINKEIIDVITKNMVHLFADGVELSLAEKYKNFYCFVRRTLKD